MDQTSKSEPGPGSLSKKKLEIHIEADGYEVPQFVNNALRPEAECQCACTAKTGGGHGGGGKAAE